MLEELQEKIIESFKAVPYPGDENIVENKPYLDIESDQIKGFFRGKSWREITIERLVNDYIGDHSACLGFMTPTAFRYYLPSYMLICICNYTEADMSYESLFYKLTRGAYSEDGDSWFDIRFECFSDDIKTVIAEFVWSMHLLHGQDSVSKSDPISIEQQAFMSYWDQYYQVDYSLKAEDIK